MLGLGYKGKPCKFRARELRNGRILSPWDGPKVFDPAAWRKWYQHEWYQHKVFDKVLEAHNILVKKGVYSVVYAWDKPRGINLLLAGFEDLNMDQVQGWMNVASQFGADESISLINPRIIQALEALRSIDLLTLYEWLISLAKAIREGNFDEIYDQLLLQGMDTLQEAYLLLLNRPDPTMVRQVIYHLASEINVNASGGSDSTIEALIEAGLRMIEGLVEMNLLGKGYPPDEAREYAQKFAISLREMIQTVRGLNRELLWDLQDAILNLLLGVPEELSLFRWTMPEWAEQWIKAIVAWFTGQTKPYPEYTFLNLMAVLITWVALTNAPESTMEVFDQLRSLLAWIAQASTIALKSERDVRLNTGFGTLWAAINATLSLWQIKGFWIREDRTGLSHVYLIGFLPGNKEQGIPSYLAIVRGDACVKCDTEENLTEIFNWLNEAIGKYGNVPQPLLGQVRARFDSDKGVIVLAFTRENPQGLDRVIYWVNEWFGDSLTPIIIAWQQEGTVYYRCIGSSSACDSLSPEEQAKIACSYVTGSPNCNAQPYEHSASSSNANPSSSSGDPITIGNPPPLFCVGEICALGG